MQFKNEDMAVNTCGSWVNRKESGSVYLQSGAGEQMMVGFKSRIRLYRQSAIQVRKGMWGLAALQPSQIPAVKSTHNLIIKIPRSDSLSPERIAPSSSVTIHRGKNEGRICLAINKGVAASNV